MDFSGTTTFCCGSQNKYILAVFKSRKTENNSLPPPYLCNKWFASLKCNYTGWTACEGWKVRFLLFLMALKLWEEGCLVHWVRKVRSEIISHFVYVRKWNMPFSSRLFSAVYPVWLVNMLPVFTCSYQILMQVGIPKHQISKSVLLLLLVLL